MISRTTLEENEREFITSEEGLVREIKFRAWSEVKKSMVYFGSHWGIDSEYGSLDFSCEDNQKNQFESFKGSNHEAILMQFTGLKDKNGKEIYEGDIFRFETIMKEDWFCVVSFEAKDAAAFVYHEPIPWGGYSVILRKEITSGNEVVGNIHENPELLKESK